MRALLEVPAALALSYALAYSLWFLIYRPRRPPKGGPPEGEDPSAR